MIVDEKPSNLAEFHGEVIQSEFRINSSAKAFMILSDGLYANKIRAIIRELSTNAVDSHIQAGKQHVPFDVHLPSLLAPYFSIRDYGVGLDHNEVVSMYTTYFDSTKTESNDYVGALGLGSKSPFSYTDNYSITAIKDGIKNIYIAFISDKNVPSLALMSSSETTEPAGVEIKFAVEANDFSAFMKEAKFVYLFLEQRPNIISSKPFQFVTFNASALDVITDNAAIYTDAAITKGPITLHQFSNVIAVMGGIPYPVDVSEIDEAFRGTQLIINFNIGDIDFKPDREGLSYTNKTINAIKKVFNEVRAEFANKLNNELMSCDGLWQKAWLLAQWINNMESSCFLYRETALTYISNNPLPTINASGRSRWSRATVGVSIDLAELVKNDLSVSVLGCVWNRANVFQLREKTSSKRGWATGGELPINLHNSSCAGDQSTVWFIVDEPLRFMKRIRLYLHKNPHVGQVVIVKQDKDSRTNTFDWFLDVCHHPDNVVYTSTLVDPGNTSSKVKAMTAVSQHSIWLSGTAYHSDDLSWSTNVPVSQLSDTETHYYFNLSGYDAIDFNRDAKSIYYSMRKCGIPALFNITKKGIYGIRRTEYEQVKDKSNWVNVKDVINNEVTLLAKTDPANFVSYDDVTEHWRSQGWFDNFWLVQLPEFVDALPESSPIKHVILKLNNNHNVNWDYVRILANEVGVQITEVEKDASRFDLYDSVLQKYPMLYLTEKMYSRDSCRKAVKLAVEYVNLIDKS